MHHEFQNFKKMDKFLTANHRDRKWGPVWGLEVEAGGGTGEETALRAPDEACITHSHPHFQALCAQGIPCSQAQLTWDGTGCFSASKQVTFVVMTRVKASGMLHSPPLDRRKENIQFLILKDYGPWMPAFHVLGAYKNVGAMEVNNLTSAYDKVILFSIIKPFGLR